MTALSHEEFVKASDPVMVREELEYLRQKKQALIEETSLLKLQRQYDSGNIKVDDLSDSQMKDLIKLYKKQISELSKSNEVRKQKLLQYRKRLQTT